MLPESEQQMVLSSYADKTEEDFWVFGYGSLMWQPGFPHRRMAPATLPGYHRSFCIYSHVWRGNWQRPGLVLGLMPGGSCRGVAFLVAAQDRDEVLSYLHERELGVYAYRPVTLAVELAAEGTVPAYCFVADTEHRTYAGRLPRDQAVEIIMEAEGKGGLNRDYLINTVKELDRHGYAEPELRALLAEVARRTGIIDQGEGI
jgi:cation transport protein ChaC